MADAMVAQVDDASANFFNPAGLTKVKGTQIIGGTIIAHQAPWQYDGQVKNPYTQKWEESHSDAEEKVLLAPHIYFAHNFGNNFAVGMALNATFPMGINWYQGDNIALYNVENNMFPITLNPNIAYLFEGIGLSVAAGFSYTYTQLSMEFLLPEDPNAGMPLTTVKTEMNDGEWGYNFGLMWDVSDRLTLGASYRSEVTHDFHGTIHAATPVQTEQGSAWVNLPKQRLALENSMPAVLWVGAAYDFTDRLTVEFDVSKTEFSTFTSQFGKWDDVYGVKLGAEYKLNSKWMIRGGLAYDQDAVPNAVKSNDTQIGEHYFVSCGAGYIGKDFKFDIALADSIFAANEVDNERLKGEFKNHVDMVQVSFTYDF